MATVKQLNAMVDAARTYAFKEIEDKVPSFFKSEAESYVSDAELLAAVKVLATAYEKAE